MKFIKKQRQHTKKILPETFKFFNLKDFIIYEYICKMYILADIKRNYIKSIFI